MFPINEFISEDLEPSRDHVCFLSTTVETILHQPHISAKSQHLPPLTQKATPLESPMSPKICF